MNIIQFPEQADASTLRMPVGGENAAGVETHAGVAYSPDGALLYVASGDTGKIVIYSTTDWKKQGEIALDGPLGAVNFTASFAATVIVSASGEWLYALDQGNWRVVVIDAQTRARAASVETGAYPYGLALSPDGQHLYVTNTGLFEYREIPGASAAISATSGLRFPPYGFPSAAARIGAQVEGKRIPGLGDANSTRGSSLWTYSLAPGKSPVLVAKLRLGLRIGEGPHKPVGVARPPASPPTKTRSMSRWRTRTRWPR